MKFLLFLFFAINDTDITLYSIPYYDSVGNVTVYVQHYDHIPTKKDSVNFGYKIDIWRKEERKKKLNR